MEDRTIEPEKLQKLSEYYKNKGMAIIGLNDSQGVDTTSMLFKKGLLEYIVSLLENANLKKIIMKIESNETPIEEITKMIKDANLKEVYPLTNGDINQIIEMLGTEKCDSLSINDKYILGINKKLVKERVE